MSMVLVTGGSGFLGSYCVSGLLQAGHHVRATLRSPQREPQVRAMIAETGVAAGDRLSFAVADLTADLGWKAAAADCEFVLHVASPFGGAAPNHEDELIVPAREGTLRVLRAARAAGVRRVVLTSSFAAIGYGHKPRPAPFTEMDWTNVHQPDVQPYIRSKALAERAAWDFMAAEGGDMELSVINPVGIFGPVLGPDFSSSIQIIRNLLRGAVPATPRIYFGLVDVRDAADLHLLAMTDAAAAGQRFLAVAGEPLSMHQVATVLREGLGERAARVPRFEMPDLLVRLLATRSAQMRQLTPQLGKRRRASNRKARDMLAWSPRPNGQIILDTARSLLDRGLADVS